MQLSANKEYIGWNNRSYLCIKSSDTEAVLRDIKAGRHFTVYGVYIKDNRLGWRSSSISKAYMCSLDDERRSV